MASQTPSWRPQKSTIVLFLLCISFSLSFEEAIITPSKKLDYPVFVEPADGEIKCGSCPCGETCGEQSPPPPPPPPPLCQPPPPPLPPPSPPPPPPPSLPPPKPSCPQNCNPVPAPPPPRFIYVPIPGVGQPKPYWIYYYSAAANRGVNLLVLALGGLSMTIVFW